MTFKPSPFVTGGDPHAILPGQDTGLGVVNPAGFVDRARNQPQNVVIDENGITITGGGITITNPGGTVIIDGTSDIFKISATGTLTVTAAMSATVTNAVALTGLGALATTPGHLSYVSQDNTVTGHRFIGELLWPSTGWVAGSSGGAATNPALTATYRARVVSVLNASNNVEVQLRADNYNLGTTPTYARYYVLVEAAM